MGISKTQLATDLDFLIADLPTVITISGVTYAGAFTDLTDVNTLEAGGFADGDSASMHLAQGDFTTLPSVGLTVSIGGHRYRITRIVKSPDDAGLRLDLESPER